MIYLWEATDYKDREYYLVHPNLLEFKKVSSNIVKVIGANWGTVDKDILSKWKKRSLFAVPGGFLQ